MRVVNFLYEIRTKIWGRALTNPGFNQSTKIDNAISNFGQIQLFTVFEIGDTFFVSLDTLG